MSTDPFRIGRFVEAQAPVYEQVKAELRRGSKTTHWMWYIFPQLAGLGFSETAKFYAISGPPEAKAYLEHPILGERLGECTRLILTHKESSAVRIFGPVDAMKLGSSMTLFGRAAADPAPFQRVIGQFYGGKEDPRTVALLTP